MKIARAESEAAIRACHAVMYQLRPHLAEAEFLAQAQRQRRAGYELAYAEIDGQVVGVAGLWQRENLVWGHHYHVDDLIVDAAHRSQGVGEAMFQWIVQRATEAGCSQLHLDSGVQRFGAHRFYLHHRMDITCHHFGLLLS